MINPKNSENALKMFQTEFETKHVIAEKSDMTEVDIKNKLTVKGIDYTTILEEYQMILGDCTITDSGTALSVTAGAGTEDGQLAQAVIDAFDYATAKEILEV